MSAIESLAQRAWAAMPTADDDGRPIYRGILDVLVIDMIASLAKRLLTNGGCIAPDPTPQQVHEYLTRKPRWFEIFFEGRRRRAIEDAVEREHRRRMRSNGVPLKDLQTGVLSMVRSLTIADVEAAMAEVKR